MNSFDHLDKYFFGGEAEAESAIRNEIFIEPRTIDELLSFRRSRYKIVTAPKGIGKTLLLSVLNESILEEDQISVFLTPRDIDCQSVFGKPTLADRITASYSQLLLAAGAQIGTYLKNSIGVSDAVTNLQFLADESGLSRPDIISRISEFLSNITPYGKEIAKAAKEIQKISKSKEILKKDINSVLKNNNNKLWILIDDIDFAAVNTSDNVDYSVCWALISAAIDLANDFPDVRCLISVRSDIWHIITNNKRLGAERLDKIQKPISLSFEEDEIKAMFTRRLTLASNDANRTKADYSLFFKSPQLVLPGIQGEKRAWDQWIAKNSRNKPRDMVHLVQALIDQSRKDRADLITDDHAYKIMLNFANERIKYIAAEYQQICPEIKFVIDDLSHQTIFQFNEVINLLKQSPSTRSIKMDGVALQPNQNESAVKLLSILHMANFINPRQDLNTEYIHYSFDGNESFVSMDNWNTMQSHRWEIHPTFHSYIEDSKRKKRG